MCTIHSHYTVGMDLGDKTISVCILDKSGKVHRRTTIPNTKKAITELFNMFDCPEKVTVAIETGTHSPWISHLLTASGIHVLVGNSRKLRFIWCSDNKSDVHDAELLARVARFDPELLKPIQHRGQEAHMDLAIIKARDALVKNRTNFINHVRGSYKSVGIRLPKCSTETFTKMVTTHDTDNTLQKLLAPLLKAIDCISAQIREYNHQIEVYCRQKYPETVCLEQVKSVGPVTALAYILTLEEPHRFTKSRDVGPYLGLTPRRDQSGTLDKPLPISKAGNKYLRRLLIGSANYILGPYGPDCDLRRYGERIAKKGNQIAKRKAKVAVARKLAVLLHYLWKTGDQYRPFMKQQSV